MWLGGWWIYFKLQGVRRLKKEYSTIKASERSLQLEKEIVD